MDSQPLSDSKPVLSEEVVKTEELAKEIVTNVQNTVLAEIDSKAGAIPDATESQPSTITKSAPESAEPPKPSLNLESGKDFGDFKSNESSPYSDEKDEINSESPEDFRDITGLLKQVNAQASLDSLEDVSYDKVKNLDFKPSTDSADNVPPKMPELSAYFTDPMTASIVDYDKFDDDIKLDSPQKETLAEIKKEDDVTSSIKKELVDDTFERDLDEIDNTAESSFLNEQPPEWLNMDESKDFTINRSAMDDTLETGLSDSIDTANSSGIMKAFNASNEPDFGTSDVKNDSQIADTSAENEKSMSFDSNRAENTSASTLNFSTDDDFSGVSVKTSLIPGSIEPIVDEPFVSFTETVPELQSSKPAEADMDHFSVSKDSATVDAANYTQNVAFGDSFGAGTIPSSTEQKEEHGTVFGNDDNTVSAFKSDNFDTPAALEHSETAPNTDLDDVAGRIPEPFSVSTATAAASAVAAATIGAGAIAAMSPVSPLLSSSTTENIEEEAFKNEMAKKDIAGDRAMETTTTLSSETSTSSPFTNVGTDTLSQDYEEPAAQALIEQHQEEAEKEPVLKSSKQSSVEQAIVEPLTTAAAATAPIELSQFEVKQPQTEPTPQSTAVEQQKTEQPPAATSSERSSFTKHLASADATSSESSFFKSDTEKTSPPPTTTNIKKPETESKQLKTIMGRKNNRRDNSQEYNDNSSPDAVYEYIQTTLGPCAAELVYWRDAKASGVVFGAGLAILFSLTCFSVISVVSNTLMLAVIAGLGARIYTYAQQTLKKTEANNPLKDYLDFEFNPSKERTQEIVDQLLSQVTCFVNKMRSVLLVEDLVVSIKYLIVFWLFTYIGAWFNGMTLIILSFIGAFSLPKVYENNKTQIDAYLDLINGKINEVTNKVPFLKKAEAEKED